MDEAPAGIKIARRNISNQRYSDDTTVVAESDKEIQPVNPKEISPEYSLEGLMLKLKLQYFGHLMRRTDSLEKTSMLRKIEGGRRRG